MVSPVTESEVPQVQSFFERISTTIVAHAAQARELHELRSAMEVLNQKLNSLAIDSENLRRDLTQAWEYNARLEQERNEAKRVAEEASADAMRARSETVQVRQESERKLAMLNSELDAGMNAHNQQEEILHRARRESNDWQQRSNHWEKLAKDNAEKLALVQAALADVRSLFEPKEMPATVEENVKNFSEQQFAANF